MWHEPSLWPIPECLLPFPPPPQGPAHFFGRLATLLSGGRRPPPGGGDAAGGGGAPVHEGDLVEKRVLIFRLLRSALCEALARVQASAGLLYLQQQQQQQQQQQGEEFEGEGEEGLFQRAARLVAASLQGVTDAFQQLERSVRDVLEAQQAQRAPPGADWQVLQGALSRVLGLHHLRRMWSRQQQQQLLQSGAAGAAAVVAGGEVPAVPALPPAGVAAQLAQARRAVGLTLLLPADTSVHSALVAAHRCAASMRGRRLIQVGVRLLVCRMRVPRGNLHPVLLPPAQEYLHLRAFPVPAVPALSRTGPRLGPDAQPAAAALDSLLPRRPGRRVRRCLPD